MHLQGLIGLRRQYHKRSCGNRGQNNYQEVHQGRTVAPVSPQGGGRVHHICLQSVLDLFEDMYIFQGKDPKERRYITRAHLPEMIAFLGTPL